MLRQRSAALVVVALAMVLLAAPALAVETMVSNFKVTFYGFVQADFIYHNRLPQGSGDGVTVVNPRDVTARNQTDVTKFSVRTSRFGFMIAGPEVVGAKTGARIEADFRGNIVSTQSDSPAMRLRQFYLEMEWPRIKFLAGQTQHLFQGTLSEVAPLFPTNILFANAGNAGNLFGGRVQLAKVRFKLDPVQAAVAVINPSNTLDDTFSIGQRSALPGFEGSVRYTLRPGLFIDITGHWNREDINETLHRQVFGWQGILLVPIGPLTWRSGGWYGQNLHVFGGTIGNDGLNAARDALAAGAPKKDIKAFGGWSEINVAWTRSVTTANGFSIANPRNEDVVTSATETRTNRAQQWMSYNSVTFALGAPLRVSFEYDYMRAQFLGRRDGEDHIGVVQFKYLF